MKKFLFVLVFLLLGCQSKNYVDLHNNSRNYTVNVTVNVTVNDYMTVPFILDTGASHCSIPYYIAIALFEDGSLTKEDFVCKQTYRVANGDIIEQNVFILKSLKIGNTYIHNVSVSISLENNSPLLLGQNALRKLEKININYKKDLLTW